MEVKPGYKQTEVGVIPKDWNVKPLSSVSTEISDGIHTTPTYVKSSEFYFVNGNNLVNDRISITDGTMCVNESEYRRLRKNLTDRTLLLSINGTIGNLAFYRGEKVVLGKSAAYINLEKNVSETFVAYCLKNRTTSLFFENALTGTTIRNLSLRSLRNTPLPFPPTIAEQHAIADALREADLLIESLDQLIAKKRDLKQAAMQQLLTGQKRLPGFHGEWEVKPLPEVCLFRGGKAHEQHISEFGRFVCVNSKFISTDGKVRKYSSTNFCPAKRNDILMVMSDLPNGHALAKAFLVEHDDLYAVNQRVCALTPYRDCPKYLFYILNRNPYFLKFDDGVSQTHLLNNIFSELSASYPTHSG